MSQANAKFPPRSSIGGRVCLEPNAKGHSQSIHEVACPALCTRQSDSFQSRDSTTPRCLSMARWAFCRVLLIISQAQTKKSSTFAVGDEGAILDVDENVVQELISQAHMQLAERPHLHVPIQSVPYCSMKGPVCGGTSSLNIFCRWSPKTS